MGIILCDSINNFILCKSLESNKTKNKSIFSRIKTVDENYPLFGKVGYEPSGAFEKLQTTENTILVNENIFKILNLKLQFFSLSFIFYFSISYSIRHSSFLREEYHEESNDSYNSCTVRSVFSI